jgi:DNA transposition AAA+ family ATPase
MNHQPNSIWSLPTIDPAPGNGRTAQDISEWRQLVTKVAGVATAGSLSKAEVARRADMAEGTFSQWFSGNYNGRLDTTNGKIRQWLASVEEMDTMQRGIPESPAYVETRTAKELFETLAYAQMMPEMVVLTLGAGMGKTFTCRHYCATRPHAYLCTMSPHTKTTHGMLLEIAAALGITQANPARLPRSIGERLQRNGRKTLLVLDEAQNLKDEAIDQARHILDNYGCGIALVGNDELYGRFASRNDGPSYAQIKRRIGKRVKRLQPYPEDITALISAWEITDPAAHRLLVGIGHKPGALGQIDKTLRLAGLLAAGDGVAITFKHVDQAWRNRSVED